MPEAGTTITIGRTLTNDIGLRNVLITLDGEHIATLKHQESMTRAIAPGQHTLRADNTFAKKTIEFELQAGEHIRFVTANRSGCGTSLLFVLGAGPIYLSLEREQAATGDDAQSL
jgi:ABC-type polysaccharide/polyol phosphate transport system ATPase subunit